MSNRLAAEASPYLLQHANNPVDWYPWGQEAFDRARDEDRPIFLSIGYSTCHWCHVMEHESFESEAVAELLNREFVPIKVDREERPDIDRVYMTFVQATTGSGGWPMSVWLTPDLKPFYGGTYFPPTSRWGRPGFVEILDEVARAWRSNRAQVVESADALTDRLRAGRNAAAGPVAATEALAGGVRQFRAAFDGRRGGFAEAPKFPRPTELLFLFREYARTGDEAARDMALQTLRAMAMGGLRDHIGGGFHRYSVDADWRVPHFEKMLYDQAQLTLACLEAAQITGDAFFADVAEDTLQYVTRELTDSAGGFYSAEDADSIPAERAGEAEIRKSEGAFYIWSDEEIGRLLGDEAEIFRARYGVSPTGNAPHDPQGEFTGRNLLYTALPISAVAEATGRSAEAIVDALARARLRLFEARTRRPRPHRDDKVLTAWNGLMIAAFARAGRVLGSRGDHAARERAETHLVAARTAALFLKQTMWDPAHGTLLRRYRAGHAAIQSYAEDYAYLIWGLLELFQADGNPAWIEWALALQAQQDLLFWDPADGGWFSTTGRDATVLLRLKEDYDGAEPSASSVSVVNLLMLAHATGSSDAMNKIERTLGLFGPRLGELARAVPMMMTGLSMHHAGMQQLVIVGEHDRLETRALLDAVGSRYSPFTIVIPVEPGAAQEQLARSLPFVGAMRMLDGRPTAYVCRDFTCREPVTSPADLHAQISMVPQA